MADKPHPARESRGRASWQRLFVGHGGTIDTVVWNFVINFMACDHWYAPEGFGQSSKRQFYHGGIFVLPLD
jgi:hypothetical protein